MSNWQQRIEQLKSSVTNSVGIFSSLVEEANKNGLSREELSNNIVKALFIVLYEIAVTTRSLK
ncbi:MAG: hypothetical protein ACJ72R_01145 [Nitrososphaeraceae archaeon]